MKIVTVYFNRKHRYEKLLTVFKSSLKRVMPKAKIKIIKPVIIKKYNRKNDITMSFLASAYYAFKSKERLIVADVDLMFLKRIDDAFNSDFDIAITVRKDRDKYYNTGLWFYRPTEGAKRFLDLWIKETERLIKEAQQTKRWIFTHGGVDQMSLHHILERNEKENFANIKKLPCLIWNACQTEWDHVTNKTRVIHIKSKLRDYALKHKTPREHLKSIKKLGIMWRSFL
jgi:hypothetical protein